MGIQFLRGNAQAPKDERNLSSTKHKDSRVIYSTYCLVPPIPMSLAKYLPPLFAAQIPSEDLQGAANIAGMPIPPMLEEGMTTAQLEDEQSGAMTISAISEQFPAKRWNACRWHH